MDPLRRASEDLIIAMKGHSFQSPEIEKAYYKLIDAIVDHRVEEVIKPKFDTRFDQFLKKVGVYRK